MNGWQKWVGALAMIVAGAIWVGALHQSVADQEKRVERVEQGQTAVMKELRTQATTNGQIDERTKNMAKQLDLLVKQALSTEGK